MVLANGSFFKHLAFACVLMATATSASALDRLPRPDDAQTGSVIETVDVIGRDDRVRVPGSRAAIAEAIGLLWQRGSGRVCTAFCAGDALIATNAHCLVRLGQRMTRALDQIRFMRAPLKGKVSDTHVSSLRFTDRDQPLLAFYTGATSARETLTAMASDWAFAKLAKPTCHGRALKITTLRRRELVAASRRGRIFMVAYHGDRDLDWRWLSKDCRLRGRSRHRALVLHTCDTFKGSSGAPLLMDTPQGPRVVAINVGTYEVSRYRVTRPTGRRRGQRSARRQLIERRIANVAILPHAFIHSLARFEAETLLRNLSDFRSVQTALRQLRLYTGQVDGLMGPRSRRAVLKFERIQGLAPLGLPTRELYQQLVSEAGRGQTGQLQQPSLPNAERSSVEQSSVENSRPRPDQPAS